MSAKKPSWKEEKKKSKEKKNRLGLVNIRSASAPQASTPPCSRSTEVFFFPTFFAVFFFFFFLEIFIRLKGGKAGVGWVGLLF